VVLLVVPLEALQIIVVRAAARKPTAAAPAVRTVAQQARTIVDLAAPQAPTGVAPQTPTAVGHRPRIEAVLRTPTEVEQLQIEVEQLEPAIEAELTLATEVEPTPVTEAARARIHPLEAETFL
jgi:hypothetical protein